MRDATFEAFYAANRDRVYRVVAAALPEADAAEATAEAFVRAYVRWRSVERHPNPVGWVVTTAINHQRSRWRRRRLVSATDLVAGPPAEPLDRSVVEAVRALPERQREVVVLRFLCDLSVEQTASLLDIAPGTVTAHTHRAVETLREALTDTREEEMQGGR